MISPSEYVGIQNGSFWWLNTSISNINDTKKLHLTKKIRINTEAKFVENL